MFVVALWELLNLTNSESNLRYLKCQMFFRNSSISSNTMCHRIISFLNVFFLSFILFFLFLFYWLIFNENLKENNEKRMFYWCMVGLRRRCDLNCDGWLVLSIFNPDYFFIVCFLVFWIFFFSIWFIGCFDVENKKNRMKISSVKRCDLNPLKVHQFC